MSIEKLSTNASLKDVMDKFEEISFQNLSNIDIVVAEQLPNTVKNGKIVIIEEEKINKIICDTRFCEDAALNNNEVYVQLSNHEDNNALKCEIINNIHLFNFYVDAIYRKLDDTVTHCEDIYMGIDGVWVKVLDSKVNIFANGKFKDDLILNKGYVSNGSVVINEISSESDTYSNCIHIEQKTSTGGQASCVTNNPIDVTNYNKLVFVLESHTYTSVTGIVNLYFGLHTGAKNSLASLKAKYSRNASDKATSTLLCEVDTSNLSGEHYVQLGVYGNGSTAGVEYYISNIYFVK